MYKELLKELKEKAQELSCEHWGDDERHLIGKGIQCMYVQAEKIIRSIENKEEKSMQVLINVSAEEIKTLQEIKEIRDMNDIVFCLHELIERATAKKPEVMVRDTDTKIGHITFRKGTKVYKCSSCGEWLTRTHKHCTRCGQAVLWEAADE